MPAAQTRFRPTTVLLHVILLALVMAGCSGAERAASTSADSSAPIEASSSERSQTAASDDVTLQLAWIPNHQFAGYFVADNNGFYAEEGLNVTIVPGGPNLFETAPVVAGGRAQFGEVYGLAGLVPAVNAGADLVLIGVQYQRLPAAILSTPDNPIRVPRDMVGKRICSAQGSQAAVDALFEGNGLPIEYTFVPVGSNAQPLLEGDCDGLNGRVTDQGVEMKLAGVEPVVLTHEKLGRSDYGNIIYVTRDYLESNRETVVRFMRATIKGWELNSEKPALGTELTVDKYGTNADLDPEIEAVKNRAQQPLLRSEITEERGLFSFDEDLIRDEVIPSLVDQGIEYPGDLGAMLDATVLEDVYAGRTSLLND